MNPEVLVSSSNGVQTIVINRPSARNAINTAVSQAIAAALDELDARADLRVAVITGAGDTFCAGMDLKAFAAGERPFLEGRGFAGLVERLPAKPIIAAVEGYALAGGFEIALACDLIVASETASFGIPEVKRGLIAAAGGLMRLPRQIPRKLAMELALTGEFMSARRAYELGLVNRLAQPGTALPEALRLASLIAANAPLSVAASKQVILDSENWATTEQFDRQQPIVARIFESSDALEGARAFAEKRAPNWRGK